MPKVFISHSTHDRVFVEQRIISLLERHGIETWYSKDDIQTAADWHRSVVKALSTCDWFLVAMSPHSAESEWVQDEVLWAFENRPNRIVPVLIEECDPISFHLRMPRIEYVDFRGSSKAEEQKAKERLLHVWGVEEHASEFERLLCCGNMEDIRRWFHDNVGLVQKALGIDSSSVFRSPVPIGSLVADCVWTLKRSFGYLIVKACILGSPTLSERGKDVIVSEIERLHQLLHEYEIHGLPGYGYSRDHPDMQDFTGVLLCGRSDEYGRKEDRLREDVYRAHMGHLEVVTYDRILRYLK